MNTKLENTLTTTFPLLYQDRHANPQHTAMCWGFECGDGWYDLIYTLSEKLEREIEKFNKENPTTEYRLRASQVKSKYGTLRFYMSSGTETIWNLITKAEKASASVCELCGNPGKLVGTTWLYTLCPYHEHKHKL